MIYRFGYYVATELFRLNKIGRRSSPGKWATKWAICGCQRGGGRKIRNIVEQVSECEWQIDYLSCFARATLVHTKPGTVGNDRCRLRSSIITHRDRHLNLHIQFGSNETISFQMYRSTTNRPPPVYHHHPPPPGNGSSCLDYFRPFPYVQTEWCSYSDGFNNMNLSTYSYILPHTGTVRLSLCLPMCMTTSHIKPSAEP